jgi:threonine dehydrogenase-like Zn-dependent dehydrogenase
MPVDMGQENTARAFWIQAPGSGAVRTEVLPRPAAGEVLVRARWSGISRGTESLVFRGGVPESQYTAMRAPFQAGDFPAPVKYGYMSAGVVEAVGEGAEALAGQPVFCLYPHQDRYVVPATAVVPIPETVPLERAVLAANMETAVNGSWDAEVGPGDRVVVVGAGVVGLLVGWICGRIPGVELTVVDPDPGKAAAAAALSLELVEDTARVPTASADVVIHASGHPAGLASALPLAGPEGRVVEMSWYGDRSVPLPLGEDFHARRLTLRSSQVGMIPPGRSRRWDYRRRLELALRLLADPSLDALFSGESAFEDLPSVMPGLADPSATVLCHRIRYPGAESSTRPTEPQSPQES